MDVIYLAAGQATRARKWTEDGKISKHNIKNNNGKSPMELNIMKNSFDNNYIITKDKYVSEYDGVKSKAMIHGLDYDTKETSETIRVGVNHLALVLGKWKGTHVALYCADNIFNLDIKRQLQNVIDEMPNKKLYSMSVTDPNPKDFISINEDGVWEDKPSSPISNRVMVGVWVVKWKDILYWVNSPKWDDSAAVYTNFLKFIKNDEVECGDNPLFKFLDVGNDERINKFINDESFD